MSLLKISVSRKANCRKHRFPVWWDYRLSYQFLSVFGFMIMWSVFRGGSCAPLVSELLNMVLNWNFLFEKGWRLVTWSRHWCVFHRLEAISDNVCKIEKWRKQLASLVEKTCLWRFQIYSIKSFTCSPGDAKHLVCRLAAFQSESLMNRLKCQIGVALIVKCFWWIFGPGEEKFHLNKKNYIWSRLIKTLNILEFICGCFNFFYYKNAGIARLVYRFSQSSIIVHPKKVKTRNKWAHRIQVTSK